MHVFDQLIVRKLKRKFNSEVFLKIVILGGQSKILESKVKNTNMVKVRLKCENHKY